MKFTIKHTFAHTAALLLFSALLSHPVTAEASSLWDSLSDQKKIEVTNEYSRFKPEELVIKTFNHPQELSEQDEIDFVDQMVEYLDENAPVYNPHFAFKKNAPSFGSVVLVYDKSSKKLVGGHVYVVRSLVENAGSAWISGTFDASPIQYVGSSEDRDEPIRWRNY